MFRPSRPVPFTQLPSRPKGFIADMAAAIEDANDALPPGCRPNFFVMASAARAYLEARTPPTREEIDAATALSIGFAMLSAWEQSGASGVEALMQNPLIKLSLPRAIAGLNAAYTALEAQPGF